jgi:O-antigen/teichoic acid export membrane protein
MSLKKNILANYVSQIYVVLIGIVMVPLYIKYMGVEAYGLVGFFSMLQAWFNLLDMGLTPTLSRETARFRGGVTTAIDYLQLVRALEGVFLIVALIGGTALYAASSYIAQDWLQVAQLPISEVQVAVQLMAVIVAMRWMCGLYRGAISGAERLVWLGGFNSVIATFRFVGVLPLLMFVGATPTVFFVFQLCVALVELGGLLFYSSRLFPGIHLGNKLSLDWTPLKPVLRFSLSIAFTSTLWVFATQSDKLILSKLLSLEDFAYFTLALLVANSIGIVSGPVSSALMPRMAKLAAEGDDAGVIRLYRKATQLVCTIAIPSALVLAFFSEQVLLAWTGNTDLARTVAPILVLYALGNALLAIGSLAYCLQFAKGDLRFHLIETPLFLAVFLPGLLWSVDRYGITGAGYAWLGTMLMFFLVWLPIIHRRFFKGQHFSWILFDVGIVLGLSLSVVSLGYYIAINSEFFVNGGRLKTAIVIVVIGVMAVIASVLVSTLGRDAMGHKRQTSLDIYL